MAVNATDPAVIYSAMKEVMLSDSYLPIVSIMNSLPPKKTYTLSHNEDNKLSWSAMPTLSKRAWSPPPNFAPPTKIGAWARGWVNSLQAKCVQVVRVIA